jgi:hypothetical protein
MLKGTYKHSEEIKKKISEANKGKHFHTVSEEARNNISKNLLGRKLSEETKQKMSLAKKGKNHPLFGKRFTKETRLKMSESQTGKKRPMEVRQKMSEAQIGEKHWRWIIDRTLILYTADWTDALRETIRIRDNYICQECGIHQDELIGRLKKLDVHHIDYNKKNCDPDNLMSLCRKCHLKTNFNRNYWLNYFNNI